MSIRILLRSLGFSLIITNIGLAVAASPSLSLPQVMAQEHDIAIKQVMVTADKSRDPKLMGQLLRVFQTNQRLIIRPFQDKTLSPAEINSHIDATRRIYHNHNIPLGLQVWFTPEGNGYVMHVQLYYSKVRSINTTQHYGYSNDLLRYYQSKMVVNHQLAPDFEHYVGLANEIPGVNYSYYYDPVARSQQRYNMYTLAKRHRFSGFIDAGRMGNNVIGYYVFGGGLGVRDILGNDALWVRYGTTSRPSKAKMVSADYRKVVGHHGTQIRGKFTYSYTKSPPFTNSYLFRGISYNYLLSVFQPIILTSQKRLSFEGGLSFMKGRNYGITQVSGTPDLYTRSSFMYIFAKLNYFKLQSIGRLWGDASITQGISPHFKYSIEGRRAGSTTTDDPKPDFTRLNADLNELIYLPHDLSLYLNAQLQASRNAPLDLSQKFDFHEGAYLSQNFLGDYGVSGRVELRYDQHLYDTWFRNIQFFGFEATGYLRNISRELIPYTSKWVGTARLGFRLDVTRQISGFFEVSQPFQKLPLDKNRDLMVFFGGGYHF